MSPDRARLLTAFENDASISARTNGSVLMFTVPESLDQPERQIWWHLSDSALAALIMKLGRGAPAAYGRGGDGFAVLVTRLEEELATFDQLRGEVVVIGDRDITVEAR